MIKKIKVHFEHKLWYMEELTEPMCVLFPFRKLFDFFLFFLILFHHITKVIEYNLSI